MSDIKQTTNSFTDPQSNQEIHAPLNNSLIHGTMRMCDLVPAYLEAIKDTPEYVQLMEHLPSVVTEPGVSEWDERWDSDEVIDLMEELEDVLVKYAPEGYYFGAHPGDGSDFGYWKQERYDLDIIQNSLDKPGEQHILLEPLVLDYHVSCASSDQQIDTDRVEKVLMNDEGVVMVGNDHHKVNINALTEESLERLRVAVMKVIAHKEIDKTDAIDVVMQRAMSGRELFADDEVSFLEKHFENCRLASYGSIEAVKIHRRQVFDELFEDCQELMDHENIPDTRRDAVRQELKNLSDMLFAKRLYDAGSTLPYNDICKEFGKIDDNATRKVTLSFMNSDSDFERDQLFRRICSGPYNDEFWSKNHHYDASVLRLLAYGTAEKAKPNDNTRSDLLAEADSFEHFHTFKLEDKPAAIKAIIERADSTSKAFTAEQVTAIENYFSKLKVPEAMSKGDEIHYRHQVADELWKEIQPEMDKRRIYPEWREEAKADLDILADGQDRYFAKLNELEEERQGGPSR